ITEIPGSPARIPGASLSTLAVIGGAEKGPVDEPIKVFGFQEFVLQVGSFRADSLMPTEAFAFFQNGGTSLMVVRVAGAGSATAFGVFTDEHTENTGSDGTG